MWFGVIFIRHGLYLDGVFKFTVYIPDNYPDGDCPVSRDGSCALPVRLGPPINGFESFEMNNRKTKKTTIKHLAAAPGGLECAADLLG